LYRLIILFFLFSLNLHADDRHISEIYQGEVDALTQSLEINWSKVREQEERNEQVRLKVERLEKAFDENDSNEARIKALQEILDEWRHYVGRTFRFFSKLSSLSQIKEISIPVAKINSLSQEDAKEWREKFKQLDERRSNELNSLEEAIRRDLNAHYRMFLEISRVRSVFYEKLMDSDGAILYSFDNMVWEDVKNEFLIVPHRFSAIFLTRYQEAKQELSLGISGYFIFLKELLVLFALILVPFFLWIVIKKSILLLDILREFILGMNSNAKWVKPAAIWIQRLIPFVPWVVSILVLSITELFLVNSFLKEVAIFIPYLKYYFYYRIARRVVVVALTTLSSNRQVNLSKDLKLKVTKTSKYICRYFFITQTIIHAFSSLVNGGIIYLTIVNFVHFLTFGLFAVIGARWIDESLGYIKGFVREDWHNKLVEQSQGLKKYLLGLPLLVACFAILIFKSIKSWAGELEVSKRISAQVFRRRVEKNHLSEDEEEGYLPLIYQMKFEDSNAFDGEAYIPLSSHIMNEIKLEIDEWLEGKSDEHSLALYGDKGAGKSTLLKAVAREYEQLNIVEIKVKNKIITEEDVYQLLSDVLTVNTDNKAIDVLVKETNSDQKTLVLIDDAHNLFLSKVGGFKGIKKFLEIINARTENIFWLATFNRYSWTYLDNVFSKNHYFRVVRKIRSWNEADLKSMIMTRHYQTGYSLSYDAIIDAAKAHDEGATHSYIEERFFRLLWEQSKGNPKTAIFLWLSSLRRSEHRKKELEVGLPVELETPPLSKLSPDALFVYNEIIRHENLTTNEILESTDLPEGVVRYALKVGLENDYIVRSKGGKYSIATELQHNITNYLRVKNFIYGE
jgi:hypothetical protein